MVFNQAIKKKIATAPTFVRSFDEMSLKTKEIEAHVKIGEQERKVKIHLPIFNGSKPEILLYCVGIFNSTGKDERFTADNYWTVLPKTLQESAYQAWQLLRNQEMTIEDLLEQDPEADEEANSLAYFQKTLNRFVAKYYRQGCRGKWISYIKKLSREDKPQHMTIDQMVARLSTMQEELMRIPCTGNKVLLDSDIRDAVIRMSNETEQKELTRKFDGDPHTATLQQIQTFLETEEEVSNIGLDDKHSGNNHQAANNNQQRKNEQNFGKSNNKKKQQNNKWPRPSRSNNGQQKWGPDAKCMRHPQHNHKWSDCILNNRSPNYNSQAAEKWRMRNDNNRNNNNNNNNQNKNQSGGGTNNNRAASYGGPTHHGQYHAQHQGHSHAQQLPPMPAASLQSFHAQSVPFMGPNSGAETPHESYSTNTLGRTNTFGPFPSYEWNSTGMYASSGTPQEKNRMYKFSDCSLSRYDCGLSAMVDDTPPEFQQKNDNRLQSTNHFHHLDSESHVQVQ